MAAEEDPARWAARGLFRFLRRSGLLAPVGARAAAAPGPGRGGGGGGGPGIAANYFIVHVLLGLLAWSAAPRPGHGYRLQLAPRPASQDVLRTPPGSDEAGEFNLSPGAAALMIGLSS